MGDIVARSRHLEPGSEFSTAGSGRISNDVQVSQAISLKRIADALERQNDLTAQLWLHQGKQDTLPDAIGGIPTHEGADHT